MIKNDIYLWGENNQHIFLGLCFFKMIFLFFCLGRWGWQKEWVWSCLLFKKQSSNNRFKRSRTLENIILGFDPRSPSLNKIKTAGRVGMSKWLEFMIIPSDLEILLLLWKSLNSSPKLCLVQYLQLSNPLQTFQRLNPRCVVLGHPEGM